MKKQHVRMVFLICLSLGLLGCQFGQKKSNSQNSKPGLKWQAVAWDQVTRPIGKPEMSKALKIMKNHWQSKAQQTVRLGGYSFLASDYVRAISKTQRLLGKVSLSKILPRHFDLIEVKSEEARPLLLTGYYEPVISASQVRNARFFQPLFQKPSHLVALDFKEYKRTFPRWRLWNSGNYPRRVRGRINRSRKVVPFYSREEIDTRGMLEGEAEVIGYVEPIDAFFLQIQGSGVLQFENGKVQTVGYADQNGHKYYAIGRALLDVIPKEEMSMQAIRDFLSRLEPRDAYDFMNLNPSYVFFQKLEGRGLTSMNTEVIDEVTIASDPRVYPRGLFSLVDRGSTSQLVVHQDTGGAIKGPNRADLFVGRGDEAEKVAGSLKDRGRLLVLIPKSAKKPW